MHRYSSRNFKLPPPPPFYLYIFSPIGYLHESWVGGGGGERTQQLTDKVTSLTATSPSPPLPPPLFPLYTGTILILNVELHVLPYNSYLDTLKLYSSIYEQRVISSPQHTSILPQHPSVNVQDANAERRTKKTELKKAILLWEPFPPGTATRGFCTPRCCISYKLLSLKSSMNTRTSIFYPQKSHNYLVKHKI
jgi:hypothetical protein